MREVPLPSFLGCGQLQKEIILSLCLCACPVPALRLRQQLQRNRRTPSSPRIPSRPLLSPFYCSVTELSLFPIQR